MSLDGLRAWIGEVERKLGMRTRVFLALTVIAIGIGGAAIYLAIDARESSVSEGDVQALQKQLEARIDELAATASTPPPEAETEPNPKPEAGKKGGSDTGNNGGAGSTSSGATGGDASATKLQELLERTKKQSEQNE
jgi:hypothetical protein